MFKVSPTAADTLNTIKDAAAGAAKVSQETVADAAAAAKEYASAGAQKTQEVFNEHVS